MSPVPKVAVIVPAYNCADFIDECLQSILGQEGPFELDVVVVDDGSSDGTAEVVARHGGVRQIAQANRGPAAARNNGIRSSTAEFVAFLDSDDLWPAGTLALRLAILTSHPHIGLVFGDCLQFRDGRDLEQTFFAELGVDAIYWGDAVEVVDAYQKLLEGNFITTGTVLMRRSCLDEIGLFDEELRLVEDLDLWLRAASHCRFGYTSAVCLKRRRHESNTSRDGLAMARAHLTVLERQVRVNPTALAQMTPRFRRRRGLAHWDLARRYAARAHWLPALRHSLAALQLHLSLRRAWHVLQAAGEALSGRRPAR